MNRFLTILVPASIIILLLSCTRKAPEIYEYYWQLNMIKDTEKNRIYEKLSFFVNANDDDGFDDIEKLYLINNKEELFWEINPRTWHKVNVQGETWIGSNGVRMQNYSDIPGGEYRIVLEDISGEYDEETFLLTRLDVQKQKIVFPAPVIKNKRLFIKGNSPVYSLWIYDKKWNFIQPHFEVKQDGFDYQRVLARKQELADGFYYYIYIFDNSIKRGIISGPFYFFIE
ncbi:MAG: hypothetical protein JXB88_13315 [Spirochaetales bacterium]|nr:hypothetical protein [Spirochaetales bacterium]